jgi:predicted amidophosphoribosyltransferase
MHIVFLQKFQNLICKQCILERNHWHLNHSIFFLVKKPTFEDVLVEIYKHREMRKKQFDIYKKQQQGQQEKQNKFRYYFTALGFTIKGLNKLFNG